MWRFEPFLILIMALILSPGCSDSITSPGQQGNDAVTAAQQGGAAKMAASSPVERPFKMIRSDLSLNWAIEADQEDGCSDNEIAGGEISGNGNFTHFGRSKIEMSSAWDIGNLLGPGDVQFDPVGPAGGPVAPVLGPDDYPYEFQFDPFSGTCDHTVSATGELLLTAANGDEVFGEVVGGETHRLDFVVAGDGVETFARIDIDGGTGRFEEATGSFVVHTIARFDFDARMFVIDLAEVLPDGSISY